MESFEKIKASISPELVRLNELIRGRLSSDNPLMAGIIESFLTRKGKQIRPIVVMLCAQAAAGIDQRVLEGAAAVELLHNASLIHDDVIDESKMRRGAPTINAVWDNHIAVLVGDYFVSTALQLAIATADLRIVDEIGRLGRLLSLGEIDQIYNAREHSLTEEAYFNIIRLKTASLFVACAKVGCFAANASPELTEALARTAELLGLCFQIRDDIFDYFPSDAIGKPTGNDLREGKITLPLLHALINTDDAQMNALAAKADLGDDEIECLYTFARENGGIDYARQTMDSLRCQAAQIRLPENRPNPLLPLFDFIIARNN